MGGGSWPRGGKKRKARPDIAGGRERQRDWESCNRTRERRILRSDTIGLADGSYESLHGRETDRDHLLNADLRSA